MGICARRRRGRIVVLAGPRRRGGGGARRAGVVARGVAVSVQRRGAAVVAHTLRENVVF